MLNLQQKDIDGWDIVRFFIYSCALVVISDIPSNWGIIYHGGRGVVLVLLLATVVLPVRHSLSILLLLAVTGKDIVTSSDLDSIQFIHSTASIWQLHLGPIRPSWLVFGCLIWQFVKLRTFIITPTIKRVILWFLTIPVITGLIYGGIFSEFASIEVVKDIKFPLMLITCTILFLTLYKRDSRSLPLILSVLVGALLARHLMDLVYFIANYGPVIIPGVSRVSVDSAKGGIVFIIFFGTILIWAHNRFLLGAVIALPAILLLATYGTRMLWITFLLGAVVLLLLLGLRRSIFFVAIITVLTVGGVWTLFVAHPDSAEIILARSKSITIGRSIDRFKVSVDLNPLSRIDPIRYAELVNIIDSHGKRYAFLWGAGYGGYYEDRAVSFPMDLKSSFPHYSFKTGKYFTSHGFPGQIFLKHGLVGLFLISGLWLIPGYSLFKILRNKKTTVNDNSIMLHDLFLCLVAFLFTSMFQLYWSGKGLFVNGVVISACMEYVSRHFVPQLVQNQQNADINL